MKTKKEREIFRDLMRDLNGRSAIYYKEKSPENLNFLYESLINFIKFSKELLGDKA